ncbi:MAG: radical SAM protein [Blautia producta]
MEFKCKKVENCFAEARTYEYELPVTGKELAFLLEGFIVKENHKFRRPVFSARKGQVEIKGLLSSNIVKINYTAEGWEEEKQQMEKWLQELKGEVLGETQSVCPKCLKMIPAWKIMREKGVYLVKNCPEHGRFEALIWEGSLESYRAWGEHVQPADLIGDAKPEEKGCPLDCGLCENHERKGCCVLLEVTQRCNLNCPICFASAGETVGEDISLEALGEQMDFLMEHGGPFNLQLSGGEPTMREDLPEIIRMGKEKGFTFFQLNTNGIRLAKEAGYAKKLKQAGLSCVFLQFDSLRDSVYETLRGRKLLKEKLQAIDACKEAGLGVVLVPVLAPGVNEEDLGALVEFAKSRMPVIRGILFSLLAIWQMSQGRNRVSYHHSANFKTYGRTNQWRNQGRGFYRRKCHKSLLHLPVQLSETGRRNFEIHGSWKSKSNGNLCSGKRCCGTPVERKMLL